MEHQKCLKCHRFISFSENLCVGVLYAIKCEHCGRDHYFSLRVPNRKYTPIGFERLGMPIPDEIHLGPAADHRSPDYKGKLIATTSLRREDHPAITKDDKIGMLYEMLAEGSIDEDMFNKFLMRIMISD